MPDGTDPDRSTTQRFYDRIASAYDLIADSSEKVAREEGIRALAVIEGERVLELGYGTGHSLIELARATGEQGQVVGLELSGGMREVASRRLRREGLAHRVQLHQGDARHLPYAEGSFDVVFMSFTLELFEAEELQGLLAGIRRVLDSKGRLGIVALAETGARSPVVEIYKWLHRHFPHFVDCRPIDVLGELTRAGFQAEKQIALSIWGLRVQTVVASPSGVAME